VTGGDLLGVGARTRLRHGHRALVCRHAHECAGRPSRPESNRAIQLSTLVTGNTYRNPTLLAKIITTLDVISGGRAVLGLGVDGVIVNLPTHGYMPGVITEVGEALRPLIS
jgi:hypothetical protein